MRYIGNKSKHLQEIHNVIKSNDISGNIFCDLFSGSGSVSEYFSDYYKIISNDFLYFSYSIVMSKIGVSNNLKFEKINKYLGHKVYDYLDNILELNTLKFSDSHFFILNNYSEKSGRKYFTNENARIIDLWRLSLEEWVKADLIDDNVYYFLLGSIVETVPFYSNIGGTYGAFLKTWDKRALKRIKILRKKPKTSKAQNIVYNKESLELLKEISGDILYLDPPYNQRQYLPNYHLLETIAKYDYPTIKGVTGIRDYTNQKSMLSMKSKVYQAFEELIMAANFKHIILSYSTDGLMKENRIKEILEKYSINECKTYRFPKQRFTSSNPKNSTKLEELLFYIEKE